MSLNKSLSGRLWNILHPDLSYTELVDYFRTTRVATFSKDIEGFLSSSKKNLASPWLLSDMEPAVARIIQAIENEERIIVYGDFDTDGITSTVILVHGLQKLGAQISYRIPEREKDGHGLKDYLLEPLTQKKIALIITCDCGINDDAEVAFATQKGIDVIVTDHHNSRPENFPTAAIAVVNPQVSPDFPDKYLSGSAVAFFVLKAVIEKFLGNQNMSHAEIEKFLAPYYEISALGIVADCVPLVGQNRIIAKQGIAHLRTTQWPGLQILFDCTNTEPMSIDEQTIGFAIAPRLNAASRVGNVLQAVQLFLGPEIELEQRFGHLDELNRRRKELTHSSVKMGETQINPTSRYQLLLDESWKPGILGLIASRFTEKMGHPVIACTINEKGNIACSCRAPKNYCIISALKSCPELFEVFGGHSGAAGFQVKPERLEALKNALDIHFSAIETPPLTLKIDTWIDPHQVSIGLLQTLQQLKPFGVGHDEPVFGIRNSQIIECKLLGENQNHARIQFQTKQSSKDFTVMAFFADHFIPYLQTGKKFDLACKLKEEWFRGKKQLKWHLVDMVAL
jgi:single-stranded-DNA-specific exonuclease